MSFTAFDSLPAATFVSPNRGGRRARFEVTQYDLAATLSSGQAFRWVCHEGVWEGVAGCHWVRLTERAGCIEVETAEDVESWGWLAEYLQIDVDLDPVLAAFPVDEPMRRAVDACRGLRLLRQDPWECLASFILSSTKQIVQIQQIVRLLCERFGQSIPVPDGHEAAFSFPSAERIARIPELELRACKMGFRAPYLKAAARAVADGELNLQAVFQMATAQARAELLKVPGVGRKIADCVLLFAFGRQDAFPVDVWVSKALRELYFPKRRVKQKRLEAFSQTHFGLYAGYAQQYLFHYMRNRRTLTRPRGTLSHPIGECWGDGRSDLTLEVLFSPAEFAALASRDLSHTVCVVFDILRATSTMMTALGNGATRIIPVAEIEEALAWHKSDPAVLLAGERDGVRILAHQTGGPDFHLGNSPREFTESAVRGRTIVISTTNGTRALRACATAQTTLIGTFLGLTALVDWIEARHPQHVLLVCAGTFDQASYEDTLAAGAVCDRIWPMYQAGRISDSAAVARQIYQNAAGNLLGAMQSARNGRRLLANPDLREDVAFCLQVDTLQFAAQMTREGIISRS